MKKLLFVLFAILIVNISQAQVIRHAKGVKSIGLTYTFKDSGHVWQPRVGIFVHNRLLVGGSLYFENFAGNHLTGSTFLVKPQIDYTLFKIGNALYFNLSAGFNVGVQNAKNTVVAIENAKLVNKEYDHTSGFVIGGNAGLNMELFIYNGLALHAGIEYVGVPNWIFGDNAFHFNGGLIYNFKFL